MRTPTRQRDVWCCEITSLRNGDDRRRNLLIHKTSYVCAAQRPRRKAVRPNTVLGGGGIFNHPYEDNPADVDTLDYQSVSLRTQEA